MDSAPVPHTVSAGGAVQIDTTQSVFSGSSIKFNGSGDYLSLADSDDWDLGTGDFTVDLWVRFASTSYVMTLIGNYAGPGSGWAVQRRSDTGALGFAWGDSRIDRTWSPSINTWYHIAVVRASGSLSMYVNGTQLGSSATYTTSLSGVSASLNVGRLSTLGVQYFSGWMDEIRILKGIARWTSNFSPPTLPYA